MDKLSLLGLKCPEDNVNITIAGANGPVTAVVRVRGLTRSEQLHAAKLNGNTTDVDSLKRSEPYILSRCMVQPSLTLEEAVEWYDTAPLSIVHPVIERIRDLSGQREDAQKSNL